MAKSQALTIPVHFIIKEFKEEDSKEKERLVKGLEGRTVPINLTSYEPHEFRSARLSFDDKSPDKYRAEFLRAEGFEPATFLPYNELRALCVPTDYISAELLADTN